MTMKKEISLTKDGGFYYRALIWHWTFVALVIIPMGIIVVLALINPFWFREPAFDATERLARRVAQFRDRVKYKIYLGTDPVFWHSLKD